MWRLVVGITIEQYEAGLNKRAEEIRAEEAEKRVQLQKLMELTERATDAEKGGLANQYSSGGRKADAGSREQRCC